MTVTPSQGVLLWFLLGLLVLCTSTTRGYVLFSLAHNSCCCHKQVLQSSLCFLQVHPLRLQVCLLLLCWGHLLQPRLHDGSCRVSTLVLLQLTKNACSHQQSTVVYQHWFTQQDLTP